MATKWKGWTARLSVKICCVILVPVMAFVFSLGAIGMAQIARENHRFDERLLFVDLSGDDYFYDQYVDHARYVAETVFGYQSEETIRTGELLEWRFSYEQPELLEWGVEYEQGVVTEEELADEEQNRWGYYKEHSQERSNGGNGHVTVYVNMHELVSKHSFGGTRYWGAIREDELNSPHAKSMIQSAMADQLYDFAYSREQLGNIGGLYYYITDGERILSNAPEHTAEFFLSQPVHHLIENEQPIAKSRSLGGYEYQSRGAYSTSIYIAFTQEMVDWQNAQWGWLQSRMIGQIVMMAAPVLAAFALIIILLCGAGRKYADEDNGIHFTALDKPWLDIGLVLLISYTAAVSLLFAEAVNIAWRYNNMRAVIAMCAAFSVLAMLPVLWWLTSFAKRRKAGGFWRYSMIYAVIIGIYSKLRSFAKSLWAGFPLTLRVGAVGVSLLIFLLICLAAESFALLFISILLFTALAVYGSLRFSRKLYLLEEGAKAASGGDYGTPISITGGKLGNIAASINSISDGISAAVTERMKSERMKNELITNVSHDIRTPLTSLITYTDLLKTEGLDSEKAPEYLEVLIQKSARLKTLTDDLFEASKAASGNIKAQVENINLADFVRQILGELDERVRASGLDFRLNLPEHAVVRADGKLLMRVMENLLSNTFKYAMPSSRIYVDVVPDGGWYRMDIKNISEHALNVEPSELTERFKRGDSARTDEGSGLGLSIAQSFVQAQGGKLEISIDGDLFKAAVYLQK